MRRSFSPLIGLLMAATLLAAVPAAFAAAPDRLPFIGSSAPTAPADVESPPALDPAGPTRPTPALGAPIPPPHLVPGAEPLPGPGLRPGPEMRPNDAEAQLLEIARPDVPHAIDARCFGSVDDGDDGSVECNWKAREDLRVAGWQLWNLRVRPDHGGRNLVAELRADTTLYVDTDVEVPGHYLYVVLGLDADGEVIARSRVMPVELAGPPSHDDPMELRCRETGSRDDETAIACEWTSTKAETAVGYVLWRGLGGDDRIVVARTGLDVNRYVDTDVTEGHRYTYVITAVDADGEVVGRSRPEHAWFPGPTPRPVPPIDVRPVPPMPAPGPRPLPVPPVPGPGPHPLPPVPGPEPRPMPVPRDTGRMDPRHPAGPPAVNPVDVTTPPVVTTTAPATGNSTVVPSTTAPKAPRTSASG